MNRTDQIVPDAPGGERAQDEPQKGKPEDRERFEQQRADVRRMLALDEPQRMPQTSCAEEGHVHVRGSDPTCYGCVVAEPEPPKAEQEPFPANCPRCKGTGECSNAQFSCMCRHHKPGCDLVYDRGDCSCVCHWTQDDAGSHRTDCGHETDCAPTKDERLCFYCGKRLVEVPYSQPKADTGTLEGRIEWLLGGNPDAAYIATHRDVLSAALSDLREKSQDVSLLAEAFDAAKAEIGTLEKCGLPVGGDALPCVFPPGHEGRCRDKAMPGPGVGPRRESTGGPLNHAAGSCVVQRAKHEPVEARLERYLAGGVSLREHIPLLRDALTELRRRQELATEYKLAMESERRMRTARASFPDLRGLVEKLKFYNVTRIADDIVTRNRECDEPNGGLTCLGRASLLTDVDWSELCDACIGHALKRHADRISVEFEAALTGTGEQK